MTALSRSRFCFPDGAVSGAELLSIPRKGLVDSAAASEVEEVAGREYLPGLCCREALTNEANDRCVVLAHGFVRNIGQFF